MLQILVALVSYVAFATCGQVKSGSDDIARSLEVIFERREMALSENVAVGNYTRENHYGRAVADHRELMLRQPFLGIVNVQHRLPRPQHRSRSLIEVLWELDLAEIGVSICGQHNGRADKIMRWALPAIVKADVKLNLAATEEIHNAMIFGNDVGPQLALGGIFGETICLSSHGDSVQSCLSALFGFDSRLFRPSCGAKRGGQSEAAYQSAEYAKNPSGEGRGLGGVGGLPLGAKIGGTLIVALTAWLVMLRGFVCLLEGRGYILKGALYILMGCFGWLLSGLFWLLSGT